MELIIIPKPTSFSFQECLWFLDRDYDDCMHKVVGNKVRKALEYNGLLGLIEISETLENIIVLQLVGNLPEKYIKEFVFDWFDCEREIKPFYELLIKDKDLAFMTKEFEGLRLMAIPNTFEAICWSIIGQQINLTFAYSLKRRLSENYGTFIEFENSKYWLFPSSKTISNLTVSELRTYQYSERKAEYLIEIGKQFANGNISKEKLAKTETNEAIKSLTSIRGIGEWTANYTLMKSLKRLECITHGDVGLFNALHAIKGFPKRPSKEEIASVFDNFKGWEAYLVFYLWRSLARK